MEGLTLDEAIKYTKEIARANRVEAENYIPTTGPYYNANLECANQYEQISMWLKELKSYKDLEEQGLLVRLPDDLNRVLYQINYRWTKCAKYGERRNKCEIYSCGRKCDSRKEYYIAKVDLQYILIGKYYDRLGKFLFFTREEAEKKLEEMKNDDR